MPMLTSSMMQPHRSYSPLPRGAAFLVALFGIPQQSIQKISHKRIAMDD
jgi:hypothetical protein